MRNDLSTDGSAGYVNLGVTPSNGCVLSWDSGANGTFDSIRQAGPFTAPVHLRLTRAPAAPTQARRAPTARPGPRSVPPRPAASRKRRTWASS
ncbi:hypothetical protein OG800_06750 [Streptomyces sp. NBC_00445]|uniref:hypothetical protein n=1 Tax=Streptomyces sp. NBC_00445 TaxID=2975745 RepID=UPI002E1C7F67